MVGSHANLMLFPLAALYWLLPDPLHAPGRPRPWHGPGGRAALPDRARLGGVPWLGPVVAVAYLAHPAVQNAVLYEFHIDPHGGHGFFTIKTLKRRQR